jgi:exonuclease III
MKLSVKDKYYLKVKGWKTIFQTSGSKKLAGVGIVIAVIMDFQPKVIRMDKEGHFILIKRKIYQELLILSIYAPNSRAPTFIKEIFTELKRTHCTSHNNCGGLQHATLLNGQIRETETKQRHSETNRNYGPNGFNRYL